MDLPVTQQPRPAGVPPPGAAGNARSAAAPSADPETAFAELLAAGLSTAAGDAALQPAAAPSKARAGGLLADSDEELPAAVDDPTAALLLASLGPLPIATMAPATAAPALQAQGEGVQAAALPLATDRRGHTAMLFAQADPAGPATGAAVRAEDADATRGAAAAAGLIQHAANEASFVAQAAMVDGRLAANAVARAPVTAELRTPVNISGWDTELGQTLVWAAQGRHGVAELRLNPPELGPLTIMIALEGNDGKDARVAFASPHAAVREAIESAMPRLREMMADAGISLGQTSVNAEAFQRPDQPERFLPRAAPAGAPGDIRAGLPAQNVPAVRAGIGIVDIFA